MEPRCGYLLLLSLWAWCQPPLQSACVTREPAQTHGILPDSHTPDLQSYPHCKNKNSHTIQQDDVILWQFPAYRTDQKETWSQNNKLCANHNLFWFSWIHCARWLTLTDRTTMSKVHLFIFQLERKGAGERRKEKGRERKQRQSSQACNHQGTRGSATIKLSATQTATLPDSL